MVYSSLEEVEAALNTVSWGPSAPLKVRFKVDQDRVMRVNDVMLTGVINTIERDGEVEFGETKPVVNVYACRQFSLPIPAKMFLKEVEYLAKELYLHEMQEAFMVAGVRILDPHK